MFLIRIVRIHNLEDFVETLMAYAAIVVLLLLGFYLTKLLVKKIFPAWYEGSSLLNKALPFFITAYGVLILIHILIEIIGNFGGIYVFGLFDEARYFNYLLSPDHAAFPFLISFMGLSQYRYDKQFIVSAESGDSIFKMAATFGFMHTLAIIISSLLNSIAEMVSIYAIPNFYFPLMLAGLWVYHKKGSDLR